MPIIARDLPVFREVAGDHAYYFSGTSPEALANAIRYWMALDSEGEAPSSEDIPRLSWADSAKQLMAAVLNKEDDQAHTVIVEKAGEPRR